MVVENYINELKATNDKYKIKKIYIEFNKEIDHKSNSPVLKEKSSCFATVFTSIFLGLSGLLIKNEISIVIKLVYALPTIITGITSLLLYLRVKSSNFNDKKLFQKYIVSILFQVTFIMFVGTYIIQWLLFSEWTNSDYIKSLGLLAISLLPVIAVSRLTAPKRFLKHFAGESRVYSNTSDGISGSVFVMLVIFNISKPYMLILLLSYLIIIFLAHFLVYELYKIKKYDYIQSLMFYRGLEL